MFATEGWGERGGRRVWGVFGRGWGMGGGGGGGLCIVMVEDRWAGLVIEGNTTS